MKKIIVLFVAASVFFPATMFAADNGKPSPSLWENLRKKIETFTPQKKIGASNAVGGVRGAPGDANDIYWKSEAGKESIDEAELLAFKKATDLAAAGEGKQASAAFSEFIKNYPDSPLRKDADQALLALAKP
jgi:TolA-binding protein